MEARKSKNNFKQAPNTSNFRLIFKNKGSETSFPLEFAEITTHPSSLQLEIRSKATTIEIRAENKDQFSEWCDVLRNFTNLFNSLPYDIIILIFSQFEFVTLGKCACVCKRWKEYTESDFLWRNLYSKKYWRDELSRGKEMEIAHEMEDSKGWKTKYKAQVAIEVQQKLNRPKTCYYCERIYKEIQNTETSCRLVFTHNRLILRYHPGRWTKHPIFRVAWSCCGDLNFNALGCIKSKHKETKFH